MEEHEMTETEKVIESMDNKSETGEIENTTAEEQNPKSVAESKTEEKETAEAEEDIEDDVDLALKSMHKENDDDDDEDKSKENKGEDEVSEKKTAQPEDIPLASTVTAENVDAVQETTTTDMNVETKECEKKSESLQDEIKLLPDEAVAASTLAEDEETKKDLIDMLLSEHAATVDEPKSETSQDLKPKIEQDSKTETVNEPETETEKAADNQETSKTDIDEYINKSSVPTESSTQESLLEEEFLDMTPEKALENKGDTSAVAAAASSAAAETPNSPKALAKDSVTSEDRVKSLISEWGDDEDEDENDNEDADLKANL